MRAYIFTNVERKILKDYISRGRKTRHFNVIASLIRKNEGNLLKDIALIETYKKKKNRKTKTSKGR